MKKLVLGVLAFASFMHAELFRSSPLFYVTGQPTAAFMRVIELWQTRYKHEPAEYTKLLEVPIEQQAQAVVELTQREWLRKAGKERWEVVDYVFAPDLYELFIQEFAALHCCAALYPQKKKYTAIVIFGATLKRVSMRMAYAVHLWQEGVRADEIILLGSERPLDKTIERMEMTEAEMMNWLWSIADLPADLRALPVTIINSRMNVDAQGNAKRPTTSDTLRDWITGYSPVGDYVGISNQPYVGYQDAVARWWLPQGVTFETVGPEAAADTQWTDYFDTLARWAWQENKILERAASTENAQAA